MVAPHVVGVVGDSGSDLSRRKLIRSTVEFSWKCGL